MLEAMAIHELEQRRARLEDYQVQARFALAESYDRANKNQEGDGEMNRPAPPFPALPGDPRLVRHEHERHPGSIGELAGQDELTDVKIDSSTDLAMQSYRDFLAQTPEGGMTPEALRRLADLKVQKEYGTLEGVKRNQESAARREVPSLHRPGGGRASRRRRCGDAQAAPSPKVAQPPCRRPSCTPMRAGRREERQGQRPGRGIEPRLRGACDTGRPGQIGGPGSHPRTGRIGGRVAGRGRRSDCAVPEASREVPALRAQRPGALPALARLRRARA